MQHKCATNRSAASWPSIVLSVALLAASFPETLGAQAMSLASPERVKGAPRVVDVRNEPTPEDVKAARTAYQQGHIVRLSNASDELIYKVAAGAAMVKQGQPNASAFARQGGKAQGVRALTKTVSAEAGERLTALRADERGALHQFTGEIAKNTPPEIRAQAEASYRQWEQSQLTPLADGPTGPPGVWTLMRASVYNRSGEWGSVQYVFSVYRLNAADKSGDYYMVLTDPLATPNFTTPVGNCASLFFVPCGWYTVSRDIQISTTPASILLDHGPTTTVESSEAGWSISVTASIPPGLTGGWGTTWTQEAVETYDNSNKTAGLAHWTENFTEEDTIKPMPPTSRNAFLSHQGAIFQVPPGSTFGVSATLSTRFRYHPGVTPVKNDPIVEVTPSGYFSATLWPPKLAVVPASIKVAPGGSGSFQVFADILGGDLGLPWSITNGPVWADVSPTTGTASKVITVQVAPGTALGTRATLSIDSTPKYASPSVVDGPLTVEVEVGQPDVQGAMLIGGASVYNSEYVSSIRSAQIFGTATHQFVGAAQLNQARSFHTTTPLLDGTILVTGGLSSSDRSSALGTAETYDPATQSFETLSGTAPCPGSPGCMITAGFGRAAVRLSDGRVLIAGGFSGGTSTDQPTCTAAAEIYNPATKTFTAVANMNAARCSQSAALLPDNRVMVSGGFSDPFTFVLATPQAEIFDPATGTFSATAKPVANAAYAGTATPMDFGVLLVGGLGTNEFGLGQMIDSGMIYDGDGNALRAAKLNRLRTFHTATRLQDGRVLIVGGNTLENGQGAVSATAEIYDHEANTLTLLSGSAACPGAPGCMLQRRTLHTATLLVDGRVLISGGIGSDGSTALSSTEIFDPNTGTFSSGPLFDARVSHTSAQLRSPSSITLADPGPQVPEREFTLMAQFKVPYPNALTGTVDFSNGSTRLGSARVLQGAAQVTMKLPAGKYPIVATYRGSDSYAPSASDPVIVEVNAPPPLIKLGSSSNPSPVGGSITFTAGLQANGPVLPSGTMRFFDGETEIGSVPVNAVQVQFTTKSLTAGNHTITASYSGDENYAPANSDPLTQTVNGLPAQTKLASSANPSAFGASVTFTATVTPEQAGQQATPSGQVVFADGSTPLAVVPLANGAARYSSSSLTQGDHQISAKYQGDATFAPSLLVSMKQSIGVTSTTTSLAPLKNPIIYGQDPVGLTVTVTGQGDTKPSGTVNLLEGTNTLASGALDSNGQATLTVAAGLGAGIHQLTASYAGNSSFAASTSQNVALTVDHAPTTTALALSATNITVGQSVTLTATVQGPGSKQTGTVTFMDGSKTVGTAELNAGTASAPISNFTQGSHSLTAVYGGDTNYSSSTSSSVALTVQATPTAVTLVSSANPASLGDGITLTATVTGAGGTPTGKVAISRGGVQVGLLDLVSGSAPFVVPALTPGTYNFTANYQGDSSFAASTSNTVSQVINRANPTIALTSSPNPSASKTPVTFTATIQGMTSLPPSGSLTFLDGTTSLGVGTINNGQASVPTNVLTVGNHNITASYAGDDNYASAASAVLVQVVNSAAVPSTTVVTSSKNPSSAGEAVGFVVGVQGQSPGPNTPTGTVTVMEGSASLGSAVLSNGSANIAVPNLSVGSHTITVSYGGDSNFSPSTSAPITQTVNATPTSSITVSSQNNPSVAGAPVTFAATVTSNNGTPSGAVTFQDGGAAIGTASLVSGTARLTVTNLSVGAHSITALYAGDGTYPAATSAPIQQQVNRASSSVRLTSDANPSNVNQQVTFQAVVTSSYQALTGTVTFLDGATALGTVPLTSGSATFRISTLSGGAHNITASYSGDPNVSANTSSVYTQQVNTLFPTTITLRSTQNPSIEGQQVMFAIDVTSTGGGVPAGTVTLSESLSGGAIIYGSAPLTNGSATITVQHLPAGVHQIYATYGGESGGNPTHTGATSLPVQQVVNPSTSTNR
jgi:hypothetical protein